MAWYRYGVSWGGYGNGPCSNWGPLPPDAQKTGTMALEKVGPDYVYTPVYYIPGRPPERERSLVAAADSDKIYDIVDLTDKGIEGLL